jgi:hypothetical protein
LSNLTYQDVLSILGYADQMTLDIEYSMLYPYHTHDAVIQEEHSYASVFASTYGERFPPTGKLAVIRRSFK